VCWPDFGLTVTPNADNYCALLRNILAGQRLKSLAMQRPYISTDQMIRMRDTLPSSAIHGKLDQLQPTSQQLDQPTLSGPATVSLAAARRLMAGAGGRRWT